MAARCSYNTRPREPARLQDCIMFPLVLHLHALVVIEEPILDIRIYHCSFALLGQISFVNGFTLCQFACSDNINIRFASSRQCAWHKAQRLSRPSDKVLPACTSAQIARNHHACLLGFPALACDGGQGSPNPLHTSFCHVRSSSSSGTGNKYPERADLKKSLNDAICEIGTTHWILVAKSSSEKTGNETFIIGSRVGAIGQ